MGVGRRFVGKAKSENCVAVMVRVNVRSQMVSAQFKSPAIVMPTL